jgi:hypothetical protein
MCNRSLAFFLFCFFLANNWASLKSSVIKLPEGYEDLIETAKTDLEYDLENFEFKFSQAMADANLDVSELRQIKEERSSTEKYLQICAQLTNNINQIKPKSKHNNSESRSDNQDTLPEEIINEGLDECKNSLILTATKLKNYTQALMDRLLARSKTKMTSEEFIYLSWLLDEWKMVCHCKQICSRAGNHLKSKKSAIVTAKPSVPPYDT